MTGKVSNLSLCNTDSFLSVSKSMFVLLKQPIGEAKIEHVHIFTVQCNYFAKNDNDHLITYSVMSYSVDDFFVVIQF